MIEQAPDKDEMKEWLDRLYHKDNKPDENIFRGVTTNPPLSRKAINDNPDYWEGWIKEQSKKESGKSAEAVFWDTYKEIVKRGAEVYLPIFETIYLPTAIFSRAGLQLGNTHGLSCTNR